jgi:hypothetical protein
MKGRANIPMYYMQWTFDVAWYYLIQYFGFDSFQVCFKQISLLIPAL